MLELNVSKDHQVVKCMKDAGPRWSASMLAIYNTLQWLSGFREHGVCALGALVERMFLSVFLAISYATSITVSLRRPNPISNV